MATTTEFESFSRAQDVLFSWEGPLHHTEIQVKIPDFSQSKFDVWGDWGPMYTIDLSKSDPVKITYKDVKSNTEESYSLEQTHLELHSPLLSSTRLKYPLFFIVIDEKKGYRFYLYLNDDSVVSEVDVLDHKDSRVLFEAALN